MFYSRNTFKKLIYKEKADVNLDGTNDIYTDTSVF